jgi:hypothetical protein
LIDKTHHFGNSSTTTGKEPQKSGRPGRSAVQGGLGKITKASQTALTVEGVSRWLVLAHLPVASDQIFGMDKLHAHSYG